MTTRGVAPSGIGVVLVALMACSKAPAPATPETSPSKTDDAGQTAPRGADETGQQEMTSPSATEQKILAIRNDDVSWKTSIAGLMPVITRPDTHSLIGDPAPIDAALVERLLDPDAYVAAHVILTQRAKAPFESSGDRWNGLTVEIAADGTVSYRPDERTELHAMWSKRLGADGALAPTEP